MGVIYNITNLFRNHGLFAPGNKNLGGFTPDMVKIHAFDNLTKVNKGVEETEVQELIGKVFQQKNGSTITAQCFGYQEFLSITTVPLPCLLLLWIAVKISTLEGTTNTVVRAGM